VPSLSLNRVLPTISTGKNGLKGNRKALADNGIPINHALVLEEDYTIDAGYRLAHKLFSHRNRFTEAIFTTSITLIEGALRLLS